MLSASWLSFLKDGELFSGLCDCKMLLEEPGVVYIDIPASCMQADSGFWDSYVPRVAKGPGIAS